MVPSLVHITTVPFSDSLMEWQSPSCHNLVYHLFQSTIRPVDHLTKFEKLSLNSCFPLKPFSWIPGLYPQCSGEVWTYSHIHYFIVVDPFPSHFNWDILYWSVSTNMPVLHCLESCRTLSLLRRLLRSRHQCFYHGLCLKGKTWSCGHLNGV